MSVAVARFASVLAISASYGAGSHTTRVRPALKSWTAPAGRQRYLVPDVPAAALALANAVTSDLVSPFLARPSLLVRK